MADFTPAVERAVTRLQKLAAGDAGQPQKQRKQRQPSSTAPDRRAEETLARFEALLAEGGALLRVAEIVSAHAKGFLSGEDAERLKAEAQRQQEEKDTTREAKRLAEQAAQRAEREKETHGQQIDRLMALLVAEQLAGRDVLNADKVSPDERKPFIVEAVRMAQEDMRAAFDRHSRDVWGDYRRAALAFHLHDGAFNTHLELEWELRTLQYLRNRAAEDFEEQFTNSDAGLRVSFVYERQGRFEDYADALANPRFVSVRNLVPVGETPTSVRAEWQAWYEKAELDQLSQADRRGPSLTTLAMAISHAVSKVDQDYILKLISAYQVGKGRHESLDMANLQERGYTAEFLAQFGTPTQQFHFCFGKPDEPRQGQPANLMMTAGIGWLVQNGCLDLAVEKLKRLSTKDLQLLRKFTGGYIVAINGMTKPKLMRLEFTDAKAVEAALAKGGNNNEQGDGLQAVLYQHLRMLANLQAAWVWLTDRSLLPFPEAELRDSMELAHAGKYGSVAELQAASLLFQWDRTEALRIGSCEASPAGNWVATKVGANLTAGEREADGFRMTVVVFILNRVLPIEVTWDNCLNFADLAERLHQAHDPAFAPDATERQRRQAAIEAMPAEVELRRLESVPGDLTQSTVDRNADKLFNTARYEYWTQRAAEVQLERHLAAMDEAYAQLDMGPAHIGRLWDLTAHLDFGERFALMGLYRFKTSVQKGVWTLVLFSEKLGMLVLDEEKDIEAALGKRELPNGDNVYDEATGWMKKKLTPAEWQRELHRLPTQEELDTVVGREPTSEEVAGIINPMQPYLQHVVTYTANRAGPGLWGRANFRLLGDRMVKHDFDKINAKNFMRMADIANLMMFVQGSLSKKSIIRGLLDGISDLLHIQIKL